MRKSNTIEWTDYTTSLVQHQGLEGFELNTDEARRILSTRVSGKRVLLDGTDVFGERVPDELLDQMFAVFALRPDLTFQVLTKRPERMREYMVDPDRYTCVDEAAAAISGESGVGVITRWPLPNVGLGVSVEDQAAADERIPALLDTPAAVRSLSCEPLLEPVDLEPWLRRVATSGPGWRMTGGSAMAIADIVLDWVIVGGESGPGARPCDLAWIRGIVAQCQAAGVSAFVKQLGSKPVTAMRGSWINELQRHGPDIQQPYGRVACGACKTEECELLWSGVRPHVERWLPLRDRAGRDMGEWPEDLRVREWPS